MRVRHANLALPRRMVDHPKASGILLEADLRIAPCGTLHAKLLVFKHRAALRAFWRDVLNRPGELSRDTAGAVRPLWCERIRLNAEGAEAESFMEVDPRYFAIVALVKGFLGMEVICHESVHAACAYARRSRGSVPVRRFTQNDDEEAICYPAGKIAAAINRTLYEHGLYED